MALDEQSRMWVIRSKRERERIRCPPDAPERSAAWNRGDAPSQAEVGLAVSPFNSVGLAPALGGMGRNRRNRRRSSHLAAAARRHHTRYTRINRHLFRLRHSIMRALYDGIDDLSAP